MWIENPLSTLSVGVTYSLQIAFAYLMVRGLCTFVRKAHLRAKMWGGFLLAAMVYWVWLCYSLLYRTAANVRSTATASPDLSPGWSWAVPPAFVSHVSRVAMWAAGFYVVALIAFAVQLGIKEWALRRFLRAGRQPSAELRSAFRNLCSDAGVSRCRLRLFDGLRSPAAAGWWRPLVLLPAELAPELEPAQLANILRHELVHIRRRDYLWDRLAAAGCRILFFHPAAWLAHRRLRWERELACDEAVVQHYDERRLQYAECLTTLARWWFLADKHSSGAIGFASPASLLGTRVRALLHEPTQYSGFQRVGRAALTLLLFAFAAASLPAMRLTLYLGERELPALSGMEAPVARAVRKLSHPAQVQTTSVRESTEPAIPDGGTNPAADRAPSALSVIERPAMPVFTASEENNGPRGDIASVTSGPEGSSAGRSGPPGAPGAPPTVSNTPNWHDTVIGAIGAGIGVIRSRTGGSSGGAGGAGAPSGGGGGEGPDHFVSPGPSD